MRCVCVTVGVKIKRVTKLETICLYYKHLNLSLSLSLSLSLFLSPSPDAYRTLHLLSTGSYALQSVVIAFMVNNHMLHPLPLEALPLPLLLALLISILVASTSFPHYIYSDKSTTLFLICTSHDVFQITMSTVAICSLAVLFK